MEDVPDEWRAYARLQKKLLKSKYLDERSWGVEAALDRVLAHIGEGRTVDEQEVRRVTASARRLWRYQAAQRTLYLAADRGLRPEEAAENAAEVALVSRRAGDENWGLLREVAMGYDYGEIAARRRTTAGALRVRVARLRKALLAA